MICFIVKEKDVKRPFIFQGLGRKNYLTTGGQIQVTGRYFSPWQEGLTRLSLTQCAWGCG